MQIEFHLLSFLKKARSPDEADQFKKKMEEMFTSFFDQLWELIPCGAVLRHNATKGSYFLIIFDICSF